MRLVCSDSAMALAAVALHAAEASTQLIADAETMEACEVLRLGDGLDVPEWLAFVRAPDLMMDPAGRVYVRGRQDPAITVLDADGGFVRTVGGQGEGPGEFVAIGAMGFVADTLWLQELADAPHLLLRLCGSTPRGATRWPPGSTSPT